MPLSQTALDVHRAALVIDLHCDLLLTSQLLGWDWGREHRPNPLPWAALFGHCDIPRLQKGGVTGLGLGLVTNPLWNRGHNAIDGYFNLLERQIEHHHELVLADTPKAFHQAKASNRIACFAGLEGAHGLCGSTEHLSEYRDRGLRYVGLVHFTRNEAAHPMVGWGTSQQGLTPFGGELVHALNALGMLVDVAHVNKPGVLEVCATSQAPVICSHTACRTVWKSPRGLDDEQIKAIAGTGGVIGVIFVGAFIGPGGVEQVVAHLDHIKRLVGIAHCAIGTDWEGFALFPRALSSAEQLPHLTEALLKHGWTEDEVHAAWGGNFLRVLAQVTSV